MLQLLRTHRATHDLPVLVCADRVPLVMELRQHLERMGVSVVLIAETGEPLLAAIQHLHQQRHLPLLVLDESESAPSP